MFYVLVNASQTLHNRMFESILKAPVLFFDRNPIGKSAAEVPGKARTHARLEDLTAFRSSKEETSCVSVCSLQEAFPILFSYSGKPECPSHRVISVHVGV